MRKDKEFLTKGGSRFEEKNSYFFEKESKNLLDSEFKTIQFSISAVSIKEEIKIKENFESYNKEREKMEIKNLEKSEIFTKSRKSPIFEKINFSKKFEERRKIVKSGSLLGKRKTPFGVFTSPDMTNGLELIKERKKLKIGTFLEKKRNFTTNGKCKKPHIIFHKINSIKVNNSKPQSSSNSSISINSKKMKKKNLNKKNILKLQNPGLELSGMSINPTKSQLNRIKHFLNKIKLETSEMINDIPMVGQSFDKRQMKERLRRTSKM